MFWRKKNRKVTLNKFLIAVKNEQSPLEKHVFELKDFMRDYKLDNNLSNVEMGLILHSLERIFLINSLLDFESLNFDFGKRKN